MANQIRLQDLTPDIYYNQSRDFQFIGRLYDAVLNSVKTNTELIYNIPFNEYTDGALIDLMTLTLGFKSKHNYNIKQLTSLCSAFVEIIKNKGNIYSVILATRALLNAEGIKDDLDYELNETNTELSLYISEKLTDINLLRDLLNYILPAGMSCRIIREVRENAGQATTEVNNSSKITVKSQKDMEKTSQITKIVSGLDAATIGDKDGFMANSEIIQIQETTEGE